MQKLKYHAALIVGNIAFGANYSIVSSLLEDSQITPRGLLYFRIVSLSVIFFIAMILTKSLRLEVEDVPKLVVTSAFIVIGRVLLLLMGMNLTSPIDGSIIATTNPIVMFVATALIFKKQISRLSALGLITAFVGVVALIYFSSVTTASLSKGSTLGNVMIFGSVIFSVAGTIMTKQLYSKYKFITVLGYSYILAMIYTALIFGKDMVAIDFNALSEAIYLELLIYIVLGGVLALSLYYFGLKGLSPSTTSTYIYIQPFVAAVLAIIRGQDKLSTAIILSSLLIFGGLYLIIRKPHPVDVSN